jgi:hypothetical protein
MIECCSSFFFHKSLEKVSRIERREARGSRNGYKDENSGGNDTCTFIWKLKEYKKYLCEHNGTNCL